MARVFTAFPPRPLHGRPPGNLAAVAFSVLMIATFGAILGTFLWLSVPALVTDWQVRRAALVLSDGTVTDNTCKGEELFEVCNMTLSAPVGTGTVERRVGYIFSSGQPGFFDVKVVADPGSPAWLTTDLGLDRFWDRVASLLALLVLLGGMIGGSLLASWRVLRRSWSWRAADSLPVALRLVSTRRVQYNQVWTVQAEDGTPERWTVPGWAKPFTLGTPGQVLGLQRMDGTKVMPLDSRLRWVSLSKAERARVLDR